MTYRSPAAVRPDARIGSRTVPRRRVRLTGRAAWLIAVVLLLATALVVPVRQYASQRERVERLEQRLQELSSSNAELEREVARLRDPKYLEQLARKCLGMVKEDEISFVTVPKDGGPAVPNPDC